MEDSCPRAIGLHLFFLFISSELQYRGQQPDSRRSSTVICLGDQTFVQFLCHLNICTYVKNVQIKIFILLQEVRSASSGLLSSTVGVGDQTFLLLLRRFLGNCLGLWGFLRWLNRRCLFGFYGRGFFRFCGRGFGGYYNFYKKEITYQK